MTPTVAKLNREVSNLQEEIRILRSFLISMVDMKDKEGEYKPEFVEETLKAASENAPHVFSNKKLFLKKLRSNG